jgi:hypothetical protein
LIINCTPCICMTKVTRLETDICVIPLETPVGCRHIYMQRQPLVELFDNIYYNCTVYIDLLEGSNGIG